MKKNLLLLGLLFICGTFVVVFLIRFFLTPRPQVIQSKQTAVIALGDSITVGQRNCKGFICEIEPNTYVYLYANSLASQGVITYANYGYSGSTAACGGICQSADPISITATSFPNAYVQKNVDLPNNQSSIEKKENLVNQTAPGIVRSHLGEFDNFHNSKIIIAWGRNDEDSPVISLDVYNQALITIASRIQKNSMNSIIFLTIPPTNFLSWNSFPDRRHEFDDRIANQANPVELDAFFSAMVWKAAYITHASIAPLSEYLWKNPSPEYFSEDNVHPSSKGYLLIAKVLEKEQGNVYMVRDTVASGSAFFIHAENPTYGQIVSEKNGTFYYSQPFFAEKNNPFKVTSKTDETTIYSNRGIVISAR